MSKADFTKCQFTYGRDWDGDNVDYSSYDYITIWMNTPANGCNNQPRCTDFNEYYQGAMLRKTKQLNKIPGWICENSIIKISKYFCRF